MIEKIRKHLQTLVIILTVIALGAIMAVGAVYVERLRSDLRDNAIQNLSHGCDRTAAGI